MLQAIRVYREFPDQNADDEISSFLQSNTKVLDIGAGANKPFERIIRVVTPLYYCLDTDPDGVFDFRSFSEIPENLSFDLSHREPDVGALDCSGRNGRRHVRFFKTQPDTGRL